MSPFHFRINSNQRSPLPDLKWYTDGALHLTLRFVGQTNAVTARAMGRASSKIRWPGFQLQMKGLGLFSHPRQTILWAGIAASEHLRGLEQTVDLVANLALQANGLEPEPKAYHPHLTLARCQGPAPEQLRALTAQYLDFDLDWPQVRHFVLYKSALPPQGAVHTPLATYELLAQVVRWHNPPRSGRAFPKNTSFFGVLNF